MSLKVPMRRHPPAYRRLLPFPELSVIRRQISRLPVSIGPDIIKNDNRYIYTISGPTLAIIDAYPAAGALVISRTEIADTPKDIFVNGDRLVLFSTRDGNTGDHFTAFRC